MYAEVLIEYKVKSLDRSFTYIIPDNLKDIVKVGMKVTVPFGNGNNTINGFVINIKNQIDIANPKTIISVVDEFLVLNKELMDMGKYMKEKTLCTLISAYQTMLPSSLKIKTNNTNYEKTNNYLVLNMPLDFVKMYINEANQNQKTILEDIINKGKVLKKEYSQSSVQTLIKKGLIKIEKEAYYRINNEDKKKKSNIVLNSEQTEVLNKVKDSFDKYETFLIHGVTGSGKTEIYMHLIEENLKRGKTSIMLVPEITLSMQIVNNFYERFGSDVAILHSALSNGEKYDEYLKILRGEAKIVVGTRSAVFAPLTNLGLIIIDEEHSESYKQDNNPRYNALDMANYRGKYNNCPVVLGSATPTYESFARSLKGVYTLLSLPNRVNNALMPTIELVDMTREAKKGSNIISNKLKLEIEDRLNRGEQVILLLNRRGFGTLVNCCNCGYTFKCPNCDITLTYHKSSNNLRCHYCGYFTNKVDVCPECKTGEVRDLGLGTERLEEEVSKLFINAKVLRMDADTTSKKGSHEKIIKAFKDEEYNVLLGTQMIAKGLDFPKVTLVGVINADTSLNIPDFRSGERTFALLNQVAGRAGRSGLLSKVIVQTYNPDNTVLRLVHKGTYLKCYQYEMAVRKKLKYPPYYFLIGIKICSSEYKDASIESSKVYTYLKNNIDSESIILGPTTASIFRINNIYRFQIVIKYRFDTKLSDVIREIDEMYINNKSVYIEVDVDPYYI